MSEGTENRQIATDERQLLERLRGLPRKLAPTNDPWRQIEARISQPATQAASRRAVLPLALAASVLLAVLVGLVVRQPATPETGAPESERVAASDFSSKEFVPNSPPPGVIELQAGELAYQAAFREYLDLRAGDSSGSSSRDRRLAEGWTEMLAAEVELLTALASHPDHPLLQSRLNDLRHHQLDYLKNLVVIDTQSWSITS